MMKLHPLAGVYAAAVTPLKADFLPDLDAIPSLLDFFARRGAHGALLLGTTGEGPSFAFPELADIFCCVRDFRLAHPDFKLLAGTGASSFTEAVDLTRLAFEQGFDGVVTIPPYYYRKVSDDGLFAFFSEVIRRAVPSTGYLLGYHIPSLTGVGFSLDLLARLKDAFPRQFAGLKDSSHDISFARALGERFGTDLLVLNGTDSYFQLALESRAQGVITAPANLNMPALRKLWDAWQAGDDLAALQAPITAARQVLEKYMPFPPILKALLARCHGFPRWPVRPPLVAVTDEVAAQAALELSGIE